MLEDAINQVVGIIKIYSDIIQITIVSKNSITILLKDKQQNVKTFKDSVELLEWCEQNLKSTFDLKPKNKIASFFDSFKK